MNSRLLRLMFSTIAMLFAARGFSAPPAIREAHFVLRDFRFSSGETLPGLRIHYRTLGSPRRDSHGIVRNAVMILHGTTGSGKQFLSENFAGVLFGPGQLLDAATHYIVLPDGIGHAFRALTDDTCMCYLCSTEYVPGTMIELDALDPELALPWGLTEPPIRSSPLSTNRIASASASSRSTRLAIRWVRASRGR